MNDTERRQVIRTETLKFLVEQIDDGECKSKPTLLVVPSKSTLNATKKQARITPAKKPDLCKSGELLGKRFRIIIKLCNGGFGQIFKAVDEQTNREIALKVEPTGQNNTFKEESRILKQCQGMVHFPKYYGGGSCESYTFIAMQLLGKNLTELRHLCHLKYPRFSSSASVRITLQCLIAIESFHQIGYLHRDIKPSNFTIGGQPEERHVIYLVDFGLCRFYLTHHKAVKLPRENVGFRGTIRYASLNTHASKELSRRDDLISWYYSFYELITGHLPWRGTNDRNAVSVLKSKFTPKVLSEKMPRGAEQLAEHIGTLKYDTKPNYNRLAESLNQILIEVNGKFEDPYDWMISDCKGLRHWES